MRLRRALLRDCSVMPRAGAAQAACLKADAEDQIAEGRLAIVRIEIPDYKLKEQAFMLQAGRRGLPRRCGQGRRGRADQAHPRVQHGRRIAQTAAGAGRQGGAGSRRAVRRAHHASPCADRDECFRASSRCRSRKPQLTTNTIERSDFSRIAVAVSPKNSFSPGRRSTPITMRLCLRFAISLRMASSAACSVRTAVLASTS